MLDRVLVILLVVAFVACQSCTSDSTCGSGAFCSKPTGECDATGTCAKLAEVCAEIYAPVCGCDGVTYGNSCSAVTSIAFSGECDAQKTCDKNSDCPDQFFCNRDGNCKGSGSCEEIPEVCPQYYSRTCGCDGEIYSSTCDAHGQGVSIRGDDCNEDSRNNTSSEDSSNVYSLGPFMLFIAVMSLFMF